ncbi:antimicrobial peptide 1-like [Leptopilina heterotoma]|uniref:antimicrobial peptide 1-like n=1 Tax=Leptopilina heterotoma TaxID=63436 RepID=UPI001CA7ED08|nr:antimicrobial peptide 1-like [Leptopilina heterotoma]
MAALRVSLILLATFLMIIAPSALGQPSRCIRNGGRCQWTGAWGNCCSTFCYQQEGWTEGYCRDRDQPPTLPPSEA